MKFSDGMKKGEEPGLNEHVDSKAYLNPSSMQVSVQFKLKESSHVTHFIQGIGFPSNQSFTSNERAESTGVKLLTPFHLAWPCEHFGWLAFLMK